MNYILLFSLTGDNDDLPAEQDTILSVNINYEGEMLGNRWTLEYLFQTWN